jgi:hypothetical protein
MQMVYMVLARTYKEIWSVEPTTSSIALSGWKMPAICKIYSSTRLPGGMARALIERVAQSARENNASRFYWHTRQDNTTARLLYDKVANYKGFIRYDYSLE